MSILNTQIEMFSNNSRYKLWKYAVIVADTKGNLFVKDGDHRCPSKAGALAYAASQTTGKIRGLMFKNDILGVWDMTTHAKTLDKLYDPTLEDENFRKGYDNAVRGLMPFKRQRQVNFLGQRSFELHPIPKKYRNDNKWRERLAFEWDQAHQNILNNNFNTSIVTYNARSYLNESFDKIKYCDKFLLAAATGSGKETSGLALIIHSHDIKKYKTDRLNIVTATIPSTISESMHELATVAGINVKGHGFIDFSRIKIYITKQWYNGYKKDCSKEALSMISARANIVNSVSDIPDNHKKGIVPILFGSYHDLALKTGLHERYIGLEKRIGTLVIGEAHQMLSKADNKMWQSLDKMFGKRCFKLFVTGTPYDFIYGNSAAEFFGVEERSLFTRSDIYKHKRIYPNGDYGEYPDFNFYGIDVAEIVAQLKLDPNWEDDANGFTWSKLFTYNKDKQCFTYEQSILWLFERMFGSNAFDPKGDPLSIDNAPGLCEFAKQHIMVALPAGNKRVNAHEYITALKHLLITHKVFNGTVFDAYKDGLGDRKDDITNSKGRTLTLTCIKDCTGANIPELGSFVFLRKLGDSIKFFEQATGRVGRRFKGKTNCGVFIGDLEASINVIVAIEEKISLERGDDFSSREIIEMNLNIYDYFTSKNGKWVKLDPIDFADILENLNSKGNNGIHYCANKTPAREGFTLLFNNIPSNNLQKIKIIQNGNNKAKNNNNIIFKQLGLPFNNKKTIDENWHNMKLTFLAKCRKLAICYNIVTILQCVALVEKAIKNKNQEILQMVGNGVEWFPIIMGDKNEIDHRFANRWIQKINDNKKDIESIFEMLEDPIHRSDDNFIAEPNRFVRRFVNSILSKLNNKKNITVFDPCAGRGCFLIYLLKKAKEQNIDIKPKNIYYNDIDISWVVFFKKINTLYELGIPEDNITCKDFLKEEWNMKFDVVVGNPPFQEITGNSTKTTDLASKFVKKAFFIGKEKAIISFVIPSNWAGAKPSFIKNILKNKETHEITFLGKYFTGVYKDVCYFVSNNINNKTNITNIISRERNEYNLNIIDSDVVLENEIAFDIILKIKRKTEQTLKSKWSRGSVNKKDFNNLKKNNSKILLITGVGKRGENTFSSMPIKKNTETHGYGKHKVVISNVGGRTHLHGVKVATEEYVGGHSVVFLFTNNKTESINLKKYLESNLIKYIISQLKHDTPNSKSLFGNIPIIDFNSFVDLYEYFNLTQKEITYIEKEMK